MNGSWGISYEISLRWMPLDLTDDKSTLVQVMAWCRQATSHYLSQCWPRSMSPNGVTRLQWVNGHIWLSGITVNRTNEFSGVTHVIPFHSYGKHSTGPSTYGPWVHTYKLFSCKSILTVCSDTAQLNEIYTSMEGCQVGHSQDFVGTILLCFTDSWIRPMC